VTKLAQKVVDETENAMRRQVFQMNTRSGATIVNVVSVQTMRKARVLTVVLFIPQLLLIILVYA
jgi:hypothetical protein